MNKLAKTIATALLSGCLLFGIAGCGEVNNSPSAPNSSTEQTHDETIVAIYANYTQYMTASGQTPLSYEQWLESVKGADGKDGVDGLTPFIGSNGNWWIGQNDTGIAAAGTPGAAGNGIVSIEKTNTEGSVDTYTITYTDGTTSTFTVTNGAQGPQGEKGEQGEQGPQGEQGVGIENVEINADGDLIVTFTDGTVKNVGKVTGSVVNTSANVGIAEIQITATKTLLENCSMISSFFKSS